MVDSVIVNPVREGPEEIAQAEKKLDALFNYLLKSAPHFPDYSIDELWQASLVVQMQNRRRMYGESVRLWPSRDCIEKAEYHFSLGEHGSSLPPLKLLKTKKGELYVDL